MRRVLWAVLLIGCAHVVKPPVTAAESATAVLEMARKRPAPDGVRARFNIKLSSPSLNVAGSTGAVLLVSRPNGRVDVLGPLGNSLVTFVTDGSRADVVSARDRAHLFADAAETAVREVTDGAAGLADVLSVLVGDLPFDDAASRRLVVRDDGYVYVTLDGPGRTAIDAVLDPATGTPVHLEAQDGRGAPLLVADYGAFVPLAEVGPLVPESLVLFLPALDLTLELGFKKWEQLPTVDAALFQPIVPEGFSSKALEEAILEAVDKVGANGSATAPDEHP